MTHPLEQAFGYTFKDQKLLEEAITHPSYSNESALSGHYQRLEFLGDAVLDLLVGEHLFEKLDQAGEGILTTRRSEMVSGKSLAQIAVEVGLGSHIRFGRGAAAEAERDGPSERILAAVLEAMIGAIYLDGGLEAARATTEMIYGQRWELVEETDERGPMDPTSRLFRWSQQQSGEMPVLEEQSIGTSAEPRFRVTVLVGADVIAQGEGTSKSEARHSACAAALAMMEQQ